MLDFAAALAERRRPRLLVRAARLGLSDYRRERDLARLMGGRSRAPDAEVLPALLEAEQQMETRRRGGDLSYSIARHVEILAALMAEVRLRNSPPSLGQP